jgi:hypothetical protein
VEVPSNLAGRTPAVPSETIVWRMGLGWSIDLQASRREREKKETR